MGWKWVAACYHETGAHRHIQKNNAEKAIALLQQIEGITP